MANIVLLDGTVFDDSAPSGATIILPWGVAYQTPSSAATAYTLTGPTSGTVGLASSNFTVTPNAALGGADSVTLSDGGGGGAFTPVSPLSFLSGATAAQTFTYTAASAGAITITVTSATLGLTVTGSPITYTASSASGGIRFNSNLNGLGGSGPFFSDRLAA